MSLSEPFEPFENKGYPEYMVGVDGVTVNTSWTYHISMIGEIPKVGQNYYNENFPQYDKCTVAEIRIKPSPAQTWVTVSMVSKMPYVDNSIVGGVLNPNNADMQWTMTAGVMEQELLKNKGYLCNWNYDMYYLKAHADTDAQTSTADDQWLNCESVIDYPATFENKYGFAEETPAPITDDGTSYAWELYKVRTKPQIEAFLNSAPVVQGTGFVDTPKRAGDFLKQINKLWNPKETFGLPDYDDCWLVTDGSIQLVDKMWQVTLGLTYAEYGWDDDLYEYVSTSPTKNPNGINAE